jgi:hypothetical protein
MKFTQLLARSRIITLTLVAGLAFATGWFSNGYRFELGNNTETYTETQTITHPDGTVETIIIDTTNKRPAVVQPAQYSVGVYAGSELDKYRPVYRMEVGRRLFWDFWLAASYDTSNMASVGIRFEF